MVQRRAAWWRVPPIDPPVAAIDGEVRIVLEDKVQLPQLYTCWLTPASTPQATPSSTC